MCVQLFFIANIVDKRVRDESYDASGISVSLLIYNVEAVLFTLILILKDLWLAKFTAQLMRIVYTLDNISIIMLSASLLALTKRKEPVAGKVIRFILYIFIIYINFFKITNIVVRMEDGIRVVSPYIFQRPVSDYFPIKWENVQFLISKVIFPIFCYLGLQVAEEDGTNQLHKYRCSVIGEGLLLMWGAYMAIQFLAARYLKITLLEGFPPLMLFVIISGALNKKNVPSTRGVFIGLLKILLTYILPAAVVGILFIFIRPQHSYYEPLFLIPFLIVSILAILVSFRINDMLSNLGNIYASDYESSLENDLAKIDYSETEMDLISAKVFNAIKKNVENTSMSVYIINTMNTLEVAYTTAKIKNSIVLSETPVLDSLVNIL